MIIRIHESDPEMIELGEHSKDRFILYGVVHRDILDGAEYDHLEEQGELETDFEIFSYRSYCQ